MGEKILDLDKMQNGESLYLSVKSFFDFMNFNGETDLFISKDETAITIIKNNGGYEFDGPLFKKNPFFHYSEREFVNFFEESNFYKKHFNTNVDKNIIQVSLTGETEEIVKIPYQVAQKDLFKKVRKEKLSPLEEIFIEENILENILIQTNIPQILNGINPIHSGIILYGVGGTGKTSVQKAISQIYKNCGAITEELNVASMSEKYISSLANNLDKKIAQIHTESENLKMPAFIFLDEATSLVMSKKSHNSSGADYYQEAVDVLKKYISNYPNLIFSITTNAEPDIYDDTLIREGRLTPIEIPNPDNLVKSKMWQHFLKKYEILDIDEKQAEKLVEIGQGNGSFINEFAKGYLPKKHLELQKQGSKSLIESLIEGKNITEQEVKNSINFENLLSDLKVYVAQNSLLRKNRTNVGFFNSF